MNCHFWKRAVPWLLLVKAVYLGGVLVSVMFWPDLDEKRFYALRVQWPREGGPVFASHFATWDAAHYLYLSEVGYVKGVPSCAFYPLWPLMIRWFSVCTGGSDLIAGIVLANVFSLAAWAVFYQVTAKRFGPTAAFWALVFLVAFPGSLFYQFIYSESLFFLLVMLLWFGLDRERYGVAWMAAFLLPLSRGVGVFSGLPIAWYWLMKHPWHWLDRWRWLGAERGRMVSDRVGNNVTTCWLYTALLTAPVLGWAAYLSLMWLWTGNPFEGIDAQKYWGVHSISNLWDVPKFLAGLFAPTTWHAFKGSVLDRTMFLLLLYTLPIIWRMGKDMVLWTYVLGILPAMSGTFVSFTRFESIVFPMFIALGVFFSTRKSWGICLLIWMASLHLVLLWRFIKFHWAG